jgi:hypothetical protein
MKTFKIPVLEQVKIWQEVTYVVSVEDDDVSAEDILDSLKRGRLCHEYPFDDVEDNGFLMETLDPIDVDYSGVELNDIKEI